MSNKLAMPARSTVYSRLDPFACNEKLIEELKAEMLPKTLHD